MSRLESDRMFLAVLETGSFTAAAARRGTSSGQASKLVARLEKELGVQLLNRTTRAVSATEAGQAYFERLRPLIEDYDTLDLAIRNIAQQPRGQLRLTAPLTFGTLELTPLLNDFATRYTDIELDVSFSDRNVNLVDEGFDMALRVGRPDDSSLIARKLCDVRILLVAAPVYLQEQAAPRSPDDLPQYDCIIDSNFRDPGRWPFRAPDGTPISAAVNGRLRYANAEACLQAVEAGLGLACLPAFVVADALHSGRVVRLLADYEPAPYGVYALYPQNRHLAAKVRALVDFLVAHYRNQPIGKPVDKY